MLLKMVVKEGPKKNEEFSIKGDLTLGRSSADFSLKDPKSSSLHAKITLNQKSQNFELEDLESSNGTFLNGQKISEITPLKAFDVIQIGQSVLQVVEIVDDSKVDQNSWQGALLRSLQEASRFFTLLPPKKKAPLKVFKTPVEISITRGLNMGEKRVFSYGPRLIGLKSLDLPIFNESFPDQAFSLFEEKGQCVLKAESPLVKINGEEAEKAVLKNGDLLSVGHMEFLVKFLDVV